MSDNVELYEKLINADLKHETMHPLLDGWFEEEAKVLRDKNASFTKVGLKPIHSTDNINHMKRNLLGVFDGVVFRLKNTLKAQETDQGKEICGEKLQNILSGQSFEDRNFPERKLIGKAVYKKFLSHLVLAT